MGYAELFGTMKYKNTEVGFVAATAYEAACNTAEEPSGGMTTGLDEHAMARQRGYVAHIRAILDGAIMRPVPDLPFTHPNMYEQVFTAPSMITVDGVPLNQSTLALSQQWQILCNELLGSNSAGMGGGVLAADADRFVNIVAALEQFLDSLEAAPSPDFPETAAPSALRTKKGGK